MQAYSDPKRASDPHALPDVEVWEHTTFEGDNPQECPRAEGWDSDGHDHGPTECDGWYWQACFPGCLPDGDPMGPFETKEEAIADAQKGAVALHTIR